MKLKLFCFRRFGAKRFLGRIGARMMDDGRLLGPKSLHNCGVTCVQSHLLLHHNIFHYFNLNLSSGKNSQIAVHRIQSRACLLSHYHINDLFIHFTFYYSCTYSLFSLFAYNSIKFNLQNMISSGETLVNPALFRCFSDSDVLLLRVCRVSEASWCSLTQHEAVPWKAFSAIPEKLIKGFAEPLIASDFLVAGLMEAHTFWQEWFWDSLTISADFKVRSTD